MTSPTSDKRGLDVVGLIVLVIIFLMVISTIVITATGGRFTSPAEASPSQPTLQAQVDALQTQVSKLASENATLQPTDTARPPTATPRVLLDMTVNVGAANVRAGPGVNHEVLGVVEQGQPLRGPYSDEKGWLEVCCVDDGKRGWISGELVLFTIPTFVPTTTIDLDALATSVAKFATPITIHYVTRTPTATNSTPITSPPSSLNAAPIYTKYLDGGGVQVLATAHVADRVLPQARDILLGMISTRPDLFAAMTRIGLKIIIFNHHRTDLSQIPELADWPIDPLQDGAFVYDAAGYTIAVPEYRLKCSPLLVHEIAHTVEHAILPGAPWFSEQRDSAYQKAMEAGLWKGDYAETNKHEYWAVAVERHFRRQAGQTALSKQDPTIAKLVISVFGDAKIPPCR